MFVDGLWDWAIIADQFPGKISPTDIDGFVEMNGRFLFLETKRIGAHIPQGQEILFKRCAKRGDVVIVIWGEKGNPERLRVYNRYCIDGIEPPIGDLLKLKMLCTQFVEYAKENPHPDCIAISTLDNPQRKA